MQVWSVLSAKPKRALSRGQRFASLAGLCILAVLLVAHSVALSVFLYQPSAGAKTLALLACLWAASLFALWLVLRFAKIVRAIPEAGRT